MAQCLITRKGGGGSNTKLAFATNMKHYSTGFSVNITLDKEYEILDAQAKSTYESGSASGNPAKIQVSTNNSNWVDYTPNTKAKYIKAIHSGSEKVGNTVSLAVMYKE